MNIIIITAVLPWRLNSGGAQAIFNLVDQQRKKHNITMIFPEDRFNLMSNARELQEIWPDVDIRPYPIYRQMLSPKFLKEKSIRAAKLHLIPNNMRFKVERVFKPYGIYYSFDFLRFVRKIIQEKRPDIIQVELFPYIKMVDYLPKDVKKIFIHHEIRFMRNERLKLNLQLTPKENKWLEKLKQEEIETLNKYDAVLTVTKTDADYLKAAGVNTHVEFSHITINTPILPFKPWNGRLSFVGGYGHIPNMEAIDWFTAKVIPFFRKKIPLDIIGTGWPDKYDNQEQGVHLKGFVAELAPAIHGSIMVVPILTGSGMRMKILEAMAMSMPIVTTTVGVEGIPLKHGESCLIADSPEDFAKAIEWLSSDPALCERMGFTANQLFVESYSPEVLAEMRNNIYQKIVGSPDLHH
jgi:glycosyltransferase involved in cell wall biosynthesis